MKIIKKIPYGKKNMLGETKCFDEIFRMFHLKNNYVFSGTLQGNRVFFKLKHPVCVR